MNRLLLIAAGVIAALLIAAPAQAHAAWLSKPEARGYVKTEAHEQWMNDDDAVDWWVERPRHCDRISRRVVDCEYVLDYNDGVSCWEVARVVLNRRDTWYDVRYPWEPDCY